MHTILIATEITHLAQRLSEVPLGRSASVAKATERSQRLLIAKIGAERNGDARMQHAISFSRRLAACGARDMTSNDEW